jgi:hypothetical protein
METAAVRKQVTDTIERARRTAQDRRARVETARTDFDALLDRVIVPLCRQVATALKASGYAFSVNTPSGAVRLSSERSADDYIEISLDTEDEMLWVVGRTRRTWGRRVLESDRPVRRSPVTDINEDDVLTFLLKELEPFVER